MAKYSYIELEVNNGQLMGLDRLSSNKKDALYANNTVYIYKSSKSNKFYIGQTKHFIERNRQHYDGYEEKFNHAHFNKVMDLFSEYFNRSALDDVEKQFITYFAADASNGKRKQQVVNYDLINLTQGNEVLEYRDEERVSSEVVLPFWEKVLYPKKWVRSKTIAELRSNALVKYSPIKTLTPQQHDFIKDILRNPDKGFIINGDAGTGKTVMLTNLVAKLIEKRKGIKVAVVVQKNWEKTAKDIFKVYGVSNNNLTIATSTKLINSKKHFDVIVIDEAHKLSRRFSKQHPSFNQVYNIKGYEKCQSHLEILKKVGKQIILMYDVLQTIRPANITRSEFKRLTTNFENKYLSTQFRIQTPKGKSYTSDDYINGIKYLLYKDTGLLKFTNFDPNFDRGVFQDKSDDAYFGYVDQQPLHKLFSWIDEDRNFHPEHVNRVLAGLVEPWKQSDGKDANIKHWHEGDRNLRWNSTQENWVNSTDDDAQDQIGSIFAVQGIDLNKVGVLMGNDLQVDKNGHLYAEPNNFYNVNGKYSKDDLEKPEYRQEFTILVLNIYYVLLTRGIDGVRLGFWHNKKLMDYVKKTLNC